MVLAGAVPGPSSDHVVTKVVTVQCFSVIGTTSVTPESRIVDTCCLRFVILPSLNLILTTLLSEIKWIFYILFFKWFSCWGGRAKSEINSFNQPNTNETKFKLTKLTKPDWSIILTEGESVMTRNMTPKFRKYFRDACPNVQASIPLTDTNQDHYFICLLRPVRVACSLQHIIDQIMSNSLFSVKHNLSGTSPV